jgi:hypothetical protein
VLSIALPAWFLYEVTIANLTSVTDDRSTGLKRWFLVAAPALTVGVGVPIATVGVSERTAAALLGLGGLFCFHQFGVFLFAGDPIGPSRRVTSHWDRVGAGRFRRFLGPGVMRSALLLLVAGGVGIVLVSLVGLERTAAAASPSSHDVAAVACFGGYALAFHVFVVGLGAFLRSRAATALSARVLLFAILFALTVGPWIFAAIAGLIAEHAGRDALIVGAPSPFYVFVMVDALGHGSPLPVVVGAITAGAYALIGLALLAAAGGRCREIIRKHEQLLDDTDRILAAEDAAAAAARAPVAADAPVTADAPEAPVSEPAPETEPSPA